MRQAGGPSVRYDGNMRMGRLILGVLLAGLVVCGLGLLALGAFPPAPKVAPIHKVMPNDRFSHG